ncbi:BamA/OMP85 family outer membrane protein [Cerasicoccus arenae]|uniref:Outer membrane protein assembly factor n=1 Tax=Cerasicoccus arenae TaxID=424488 RepID=A0A8J3DDR7_9BACT|nr:BamA/TamA family outer membrane protein [Cerasicoccus arenae]MBK1857823.1 BamA/TamA family outer membrane protein [Cerasicoccus arenae]GHC11668.1 hypothetical protein GCM10007047_31200 [Cerasicoccus arenae]
MDHLRGLIRWLALLTLLLVPGMARAGSLFGLIGDPNVTVSGFGWFANIYLERALQILDVEGEQRDSYNGIFLEDAIWILAGEIKQKGYLEPEIDVTLFNNGEIVFESVWSKGDLEPNAPRDLEGDTVQFRIRAGQLFYFDSLTIDGLPAGFPGQPASYFYATDQLIVSQSDRYFTEGRFRAGLSSITQTLKDLGHREAKVTKSDFNIDSATGAVTCTATIDPGPVYYTSSLIVRIYQPDETSEGKIQTIDPPNNAVRLDAGAEAEKAETSLESESETTFAERRLNPDWIGTNIQKLRRQYFAEGYPEVYIDADYEIADEDADRVTGTLVLQVHPGAHATLHAVRFEGGDDIAPWLLEKQAGAKPGEPLNRSAIEEGRSRLSKLGVFRRVQIDYEEVEPGQWDAIYELTPKGTTELDLIFGVGSFDIIRVGFQVDRNNLWGIAHRAKFRAVQSFKATYIDLDYFIPQIMGADLDFFSKINYLNRQELTFDREEWGARAGLQHYFSSLNINGSISYGLDNVKAANRDFVVPPGPLEARIGSLGFKFVQTELDSPVFPTDGYQWYLDGEFARPELGGNVSYDSFEVGGAWHHPLGDIGLILHLGFRHGVIITDGEPAEQIPVNRRFFLGGENTVRGYKRDQAAPVNLNGQQIGAVSYMLWQGELEQRINETFSVVAFVDAVGNAATIQNYPFNEVLISVGAGISVRTIVGPLRFEYGYNVKKREIDPIGRFQVGLGFPF